MVSPGLKRQTPQHVTEEIRMADTQQTFIPPSGGTVPTPDTTIVSNIEQVGEKPEPKFLVPYSLLMDFEGGYMTWSQLLEQLYKHAGVE